MVINFKTKTDLNGNTYYLILSTDNKAFRRDYNLRTAGDVTIQIGKRDMNRLEKELISNGFKKQY